MDDLPPFLGSFHSANLTRHPTAGVGGFSDGQLARVIRNGVLPDGQRVMVMPAYPGLSDGDLSAILGFLRSDDPLFAPEPAPQARPAPSVVGRLILAFVVGAAPRPSAPVVAAPLRGPTAEYGEYLADQVLHCHGCHTAGFAADKLQGPGAYAGGFELVGGQGRKILTPNITPDPETGVGRWSREQLVRALRDGIRRGRQRHRAADAPLPRAGRRRADRHRHLPPQPSGRPERRSEAGGRGRPHGRPGRGPLRQPRLHRLPRPGRALPGQAARRRRPFARGGGRPDPHAEKYASGSQMPTFAGVLSLAEARALAEHVKGEAGARASAE